MEAPRTIPVYVAELSPRAAALVLFLVATFTVPTVISLHDPIAAIPFAAILAFMSLDWGGFVIGGLHAVVYVPLLSGCAWIAARFICARENAGARAGIFLALIAGLIALPFFPVYGTAMDGLYLSYTGSQLVDRLINFREEYERNRQQRGKDRQDDRPRKDYPTPAPGSTRKGRLT